MRIISDEMISPKIVRVVANTILKADWQLDSVYNANLTGKADEDWIATFARIGGHAFISGDRKMLKRKALLAQISSTGLIGIYLPTFFAGAKREQQLAYFIHWWKKIEVQIENASPGTAWIVPKGMGGGELRQHNIGADNGSSRKAN